MALFDAGAAAPSPSRLGTYVAARHKNEPRYPTIVVTWTPPGQPRQTTHDWPILSSRAQAVRNTDSHNFVPHLEAF